MKFFLILLLLLSSLNFAQTGFEYDYARFYNNDSSGYVEIYYSFDPGKMSDNPETGRLEGELRVILIKKENSQISLDKKWQFSVDSEEKGKGNLQTGLIRIPVKEGDYICTVKAIDLNSDKPITESDFDMEINTPGANTAGMSDLQVATAIKQHSENKESIFYKNSLEVIPNTSLVFGDNAPVVFFYTEFYNLDKSNSDNYTVTHRLVNTNKETTYEETKNIKPVAGSIVELGAVKVKDMPTGAYDLMVALSSKENRFTVAKNKRIFVYNRDMIDSTSFRKPDNNFFASGLTFMEDEELKDIFEKAEYIATGKEKDTWDDLKTVEAKRKFMVKFWNNRENQFIPGTYIDYKDYYDRIKYAREKYGNLGMKQGWKSDRGRVYVVYGKPTKIDRFHFQQDSKPYEVWYYDHLEGGVIFVFGDQTGFNEYRLVHSTKKGEIYSSDTEQMLRNR